jgi:hypothetical protein
VADDDTIFPLFRFCFVLVLNEREAPLELNVEGNAQANRPWLSLYSMQDSTIAACVGRIRLLSADFMVRRERVERDFDLRGCVSQVPSGTVITLVISSFLFSNTLALATSARNPSTIHHKYLFMTNNADNMLC